MISKTSIKGKPDTRAALLQAGLEIMLEKGYSNTGIQEVLSALSVPKGSFYHYFDSKEDFALGIIRNFDEKRSSCLLRTLQNPEKTPLERLRSYCEAEKSNFLSGECRRGCLISNLSQEMSDQSETLRVELSSSIMKRRDLFIDCIAEGQRAGEINNNFSATEYADIFESGWSGALMRAKTIKTGEPMQIFINLMFSHFLKN